MITVMRKVTSMITRVAQSFEIAMYACFSVIGCSLVPSHLSPVLPGRTPMLSPQSREDSNDEHRHVYSPSYKSHGEREN